MSEKISNFEDVLPKLLKLQIFADFSPDNENDVEIMKQVYLRLKLKTVKAGTIIIQEGDFGEEFYILEDGKVQILRNTLSGDVITLANLNADMGIFFGETALISKDTRTATVKALSDCKLLVLTGEDFLAIGDEYPLFGFRVSLCIARRLANNVRKTNGDMTTLYEALFSEIEDAGAR